MKILKICALIFLVMFTVGTVSAAWVEPTGNPTSGNPPAPVNVGEGDQVKEGGFSAGWLRSDGFASVGGFLQVKPLGPSGSTGIGVSILGSGIAIDMQSEEIEGRSILSSLIFSTKGNDRLTIDDSGIKAHSVVMDALDALLSVEGDVAANRFCDLSGNCISSSDLTSGDSLPPGSEEGQILRLNREPNDRGSFTFEWEASPNIFDLSGGLNATKGITTPSFILSGGEPAENKVLASVDDKGLAEWKSLSDLGVGIDSLPRRNGKMVFWNSVLPGWESTSYITTSNTIPDTFIGGTLHINKVNEGTIGGNIEVSNQLKIEGGDPGNNKILVSDADGWGSWKSPSEIGLGSGTDLPNGTNNAILRLAGDGNNWRASTVGTLDAAGNLGAFTLTSLDNASIGRDLTVAGSATIGTTLNVGGKTTTDGIDVMGSVVTTGSVTAGGAGDFKSHVAVAKTAAGTHGYLSGEYIYLKSGAAAGKVLVARDSSGLADWKTPDEGGIRPLFIVMNWNNTASNNVFNYSYTSPGTYYRGSGSKYGDAPAPYCDDSKYCYFSCPDGFVIMSGSTMCNDSYSVSRGYLRGDDEWQTGCIQDLAIFDFNVDIKAYPENVRIICVDEDTVK